MKNGPRILDGFLAGKVLTPIVNPKIRPTAERVRRSFFDSVAFSIRGNTFIDAFAGSGIMGIEALSRGAGHAVFLESDSDVCDQIQRNLGKCGIQQIGTVIQGEITHTIDLSLKTAANAILFFDPPYMENVMPSILTNLRKSDNSEQIDMVIVEHHHKTDPLAGTIGWHVTHQKKYGETMLTYMHSDKPDFGGML